MCLPIGGVLTCADTWNSSQWTRWIVHPDFSGDGYATEAARAFMDTAFRVWDLHRVYAQLDPRNESSARLCERLGMRKEAHLRDESWFKGEWGDLAIYAILESEWLDR